MRNTKLIERGCATGASVRYGTCLLAEGKRAVSKNLILAAIHWTEIRGLRLTARWRRSTQCAEWCHKTGLSEQWVSSYSEKPNKMQQCIKILLFPILNEARHVSGDTPSIIRSLKLHKQPLVLHTWKVVRRAVVGQRPTTVSKLYQNFIIPYTTAQEPTLLSL